MKINSAQSLFIIIGFFLATLSLGAGLTLVTESQDIRQMAAGGDAVVPSCSIALQSGDIVVSFSKNTSKFLSAKDITRATVEAINISGGSIPAGTYRVFLESYDDHDGTVYTPGDIHYQISITSSSPNILNLWVKKTPVLPWWRSQIGDIYGLMLKSMMSDSTQFLTSQLNASDPGVVIWGNGYELNKGQLSTSTFKLTSQQRVALKENYAYFDQLTRGYPKTEITDNTKPASLPPLAQDRQAHMLKKSGDLNLTTNWGAPNEKLVVLVSDNLKISTNQQVPVGSFLQFIVSGNIIIGPSVTSLHGIFSADGSVVIESSDQPFEASGSVVSFSPSGIMSKRSLPSGDNATRASTIFTYRPDLVVNVPLEIRHKKSVWSEVP